ncbi:putative mitochondrial genome maintenance protein [Lanmaoa asiatica]|nr:putative mitochondrial genome maintenance protein [Lanmaoa asiatica]
MSFVAKSARLCLTARRAEISYHRTYATSTRTYPARSAATSSRVTKAPASTTTNEISQKDISEAIADVAVVREALEDGVPPESVPSAESASSRLSQIAFPGDFVSGGDSEANDWSKSYYGLSVEAFPREIADVLLAPIDEMDIEIKPDGLIYLPEIKYRRILNKAFGPGAWGLAPRTETNVGPKIVSREYALVCQGRLVAIARGENEYFDPSGIPTAAEGCKSNALMRCCKDLGIASELWDPRFIREFKTTYCVEVFAENLTTKKKRKLWRRKDQPKFEYPWKE